MNAATTFHVVNYRMQRNEMCRYCADLLYLNFVACFVISSPWGDLLKRNAREFFPCVRKVSAQSAGYPWSTCYCLTNLRIILFLSLMIASR
jgi:hypothetical protein